MTTTVTSSVVDSVVGLRICLDCPARVKLRARQRCHRCHRRAERAALKRPCIGCTQLRHLRTDGWCAGCSRAAAPRKPPKTIGCGRCGEQRRDVGHGLCNRCALADPDRPFRYAASLAGRMAPTPAWWDPLVEFTAARCYPGGTVAVLRETGRLLISDPSMTPHQLGRLPTTAVTATTARMLTAFFTVHGLALAPDRPRQRAAARREWFVAAVAAPLHDAVAEFDHTQIGEQDRRRRTGQRTLSDITLETRLRILRDLAAHLHAPPHHHRLGRGRHRGPGGLPRSRPGRSPPADLRSAAVLRLGQGSQAHPHRPHPRVVPRRSTGVHRDRAGHQRPAGPVPPLDQRHHPRPRAARRPARPAARGVQRGDPRPARRRHRHHPTNGGPGRTAVSDTARPTHLDGATTMPDRSGNRPHAQPARHRHPGHQRPRHRRGFQLPHPAARPRPARHPRPAARPG